METLSEINRFLKEVYNDILLLEQKELAHHEKCKLTVTELHIIDKIGIDSCPSMSDVAERLGITLATMTTAADRLEKKNCIIRLRSNKDKRIVTLSLTKHGKAAFVAHQKFHERLVNSTIAGISPYDQRIFLKALQNLNNFFLSQLNENPSKEIHNP